MSDRKMTSRPPLGSAGDVEEFIAGAGTQPGATAGPVREGGIKPEAFYPWETPGIREDVTKVFNLRLAEPYLLKLKYIAEHTPDSMQQFCLHVLLPAINAKIEELTSTD